MQIQIAFSDWFYFYVQPVNFHGNYFREIQNERISFQRISTTLTEVNCELKSELHREKERRNKKEMRRKGFSLSTLRISLSNSTIFHLLQPIR